MAQWLDNKGKIRPTIKVLVGIVMSVLILLLLAIGLIITFIFQFSDVRHQTEAISPNHELKVVLFNTNDGWESYDWNYEIHNLKTGNKKTLGECSGGGLIPYKLLRWTDNQHFIVQAMLEKPQAPKPFTVNINTPKIPCDFSMWDLLSPSDQAKLSSHYIIIPSKISINKH